MRDKPLSMSIQRAMMDAYNAARPESVDSAVSGPSMQVAFRSVIDHLLAEEPPGD